MAWHQIHENGVLLTLHSLVMKPGPHQRLIGAENQPTQVLLKDTGRASEGCKAYTRV